MTHQEEKIGVCKGGCALPPCGWDGPNSGSNPVSLLMSGVTFFELQTFHSQNETNASLYKVVKD